MDILPEHGVGRSLLQATKQFADQSHHPELATSKLILFSFSGGGSMVKDDWKEPVWNVNAAWITPPRGSAPAGGKDAGWMPSKQFAEAWLAFEKEQTHSITPLE